eukprot:3624342-Rhodomonas_salina.2
MELDVKVDKVTASLLTLEMQYGEDIRAQEFQWREDKKKEEEQDDQASEVDTEPDCDMDPASYASTVVTAIRRRRNVSGTDNLNQNETMHETITASNETEAVATVKPGEVKRTRLHNFTMMGIRTSPPHSIKTGKCRRRKSRKKAKEGMTSEAEVGNLQQLVKASKISVNPSTDTGGNAQKMETPGSSSTAIKASLSANTPCTAYYAYRLDIARITMQKDPTWATHFTHMDPRWGITPLSTL